MIFGGSVLLAGFDFDAARVFFAGMNRPSEANADVGSIQTAPDVRLAS